VPKVLPAGGRMTPITLDVRTWAQVPRHPVAVILANVLLPLVGIVVGGWLTYFLNVRSRQRTYVEDLYNKAISAVMAARNSVDYVATIGPPEHSVSDDAWRELGDWFILQGLKNWWTNLHAAHDALAQVQPYQPAIAGLLPVTIDQGHKDVEGIIRLLLDGREQARRRRQRWNGAHPAS